MKINFRLPTKEEVKTGAEMAGRLTKKIAIKGVQALVLETATKTLNASFEGDMDKVKEQLTFDGIVGPKKADKPKKKWFSKKKDEAEELLDEIQEFGDESDAVTFTEVPVEKEETVIVPNDDDVEVIDKKKKK